MDKTSERGMSFVGALITFGIVAGLCIYIIRWCQKTINESRADTILNGAVELAEYEKDRLDAGEAGAVEQPGSIERKGYGFSVVEGSTSTLVKIETEKTTIGAGICTVLKKKLKKSMWRDVFQKVLVVDKLGDEKTDISIYDCPKDRIPALRFYVKFDGEEEDEEEDGKKKRKDKDKEEEEEIIFPTDGYGPVTATRPGRVTVPSANRKSTTSACPPGASRKGKGVVAGNGCRCNYQGDTWNGRACVGSGNCPAGSSREASQETDETNIPGCYCNPQTPVWSGQKCVKSCSGNRVFDVEKGECVCPDNMVMKSDSLNVCVDCNQTSDCPSGYKCVANKCVGDEREYNDCRWGICQVCDADGRRNIPASHPCEVAGLEGLCNGNGTCYPTGGRSCSALKKCSKGEFCNYGGTYNSNRKQKGKFGQTPNVCQTVNHQELTYKNTTYYFNTQKDLKSWCRAANNKANCKWGYLAKPGAESWCASLGKRLLTRSEMASVWDTLRTQLPKTYRGYAYWVQEGVWLEDKQGKLGFGKGRPDGYGGRGGVVCK